MISEALGIPEKVKKASVSFTLSVLTVAIVILSAAVYSLYQDQAGTRLAVVETRLDEMDKKLDKMDAKLDRLLER